MVLIYDITNYASFENLTDWLNVVKKTYSERKEALPYLALVGNKTDLEHLRTVQPQKHAQFAKDENLHAFSASAKQGDQVKAIFTRIAADLAQVGLSKADLEGATQVVPAQIINHPRHDPNQEQLVLKTKEKGKGCTVM